MNLEPYIGLEFEDCGRGPRFDCWGLVRHVFKNEFSIELDPFNGLYESAKDWRGIPGVVEDQKTRWEPVANPRPGDCVLFNVCGHPMHVGIIVEPGKMLHIEKGKNSCLERFLTPKWKAKIEGFYSYKH